jgi:hypothetical protein
VRYEIKSEPYDCGWCHCRTCQLNSGAPAMVFATVPVGDLVWTKGGEKVRTFASSDFGYRAFCGDCGTPLWMKLDDQPDTLDFSVATLDEPERVTPGFHIFWGSRMGGAEPADALPRYEKFRPDTRGLGSEQPA